MKGEEEGGVVKTEGRGVRGGRMDGKGGGDERKVEEETKKRRRRKTGR